jgi:hypothetical protein
MSQTENPRLQAWGNVTHRGRNAKTTGALSVTPQKLDWHEVVVAS